MMFNFIRCHWSKLLSVSEVKLTEIELIIAPKGASNAINIDALELHKIKSGVISFG